MGGDVPFQFLPIRLIPISIHAPRVGGDKIKIAAETGIAISIHAPRVGGDFLPFLSSLSRVDFNPRPPCGGRQIFRKLWSLHKRFQSTPPVWGATGGLCRRSGHGGDFNPRPPCGGRLELGLQHIPIDLISIHAPRVGGDRALRTVSSTSFRFQSTPPVWGATPAATMVSMTSRLFQSTPPVWGATGDRRRVRRRGRHFNPRPPCGGRLPSRSMLQAVKLFQSTPPVWGATCIRCCRRTRNPLFQSTPPVWGATASLGACGLQSGISIHAPRVGGDHQVRSSGVNTGNFNPRPPCGGRRFHTNREDVDLLTFQSTPPVWGATLALSALECREIFQSTPPVWGATFLYQ